MMAVALAVAAVAAAIGLLGTAGLGHTPAAEASISGIRVSGNRLVDATGHPVRLLGVDRSGTEYACIQGWGIFDGPSDATSVGAIASWHVDAVRVPLNEDCWLGINGVNPAYGGANYRSAIQHYVSLLNADGIVAILDLHWNAPGTEPATGQQVMADATHAPAFWTSVASTFKSTPDVLFDLYNEPHTISWTCWLHGCTTSAGWRAAGMQTLLDAVRATGAGQPVMVGGLNWSGDLSGWLAHEPVDPDHQLVASVHLYTFSQCNTESCWNQTIAPVAAQVPVVTGELGETDCGASFIDTYMPWADAHGISYLGWAWDAGGGWSCSNGPGLLNDFSGSPNSYGAGLKAHLAALAATSTATTPSTTTTAPPSTTTTTAPPAATPAPAAGTATQATATLTQSWGTGGVVDLHVTNTGSTTLGTAAHPWALRFQLPAGTSISDMWNAQLRSQANGSVSAVAPAYTLALGPGQSMDVGWVEQGGTALPSSVAVTAPVPAAASAVLSTTYQLAQSWGNGGNGAITVTNVAPVGSEPWSLAFRLPSGTTVTTMWCAELTSQTGGSVRAMAPPWATALASGQSVTVGWTQSGSAAAPTTVRVTD